jgi:hypothetical protein
MAFNLSNLVPFDAVASDGSYKYGLIFDYSTSDNMATVDGGSYWDDFGAAKCLRRGDWLRVTASDGKAIYMVSSSSFSTPSVVVGKEATVSSF